MIERDGWMSSGRSSVVAAITRSRVGMVLTVVFLAVLLWLGGAPLTYDEPWYLETVGLLHEHGLTIDFLRHLPGPAGPLYTVVHALFEPVTRLAPPAVRWVNPLLLGLTILAVNGTLRSAQRQDRWSVAATCFAIPMTWPCAGLALTEIPAVCAYAVHLACLTRCLQGDSRHRLWAVLAGVALGAATLGRQPLLLGALPLVYVGVRDTARRGDIAVLLAVACACVLPVFAVWGGVVPPKTAAIVGGGLSSRHVILAGAYAAACTAIVCPDILVWKPRLVAVCVVAAVGIASVDPFAVSLPLHTLTARVVPGSVLPWATRVMQLLVIGAGLWFYASCAITLARRSDDMMFTFVLGSVLLQVLSALAVKHQFSGRYLLTAMPLFAWLAAERRPGSRAGHLRLCLGGAIGCASLINYLKGAGPFDM
ncbi:MAG: hypothetical protein ACOYK7_02900 [Pirellulales bacterium]|jgi:hypothetical protein